MSSGKVASVRARAIDRRDLPPCTLYRLRMAARRATRLYDQAMRPAGLGAAQFGILMALAARDGSTVTDLAQALDLDRTTLTRNLRPLVRADLVTVTAGRDQRSRSVRLTPCGTQRLALARQCWRHAQAALAASLGSAATETLNDLLATVVERLP